MMMHIKLNVMRQIHKGSTGATLSLSCFYHKCWRLHGFLASVASFVPKVHRRGAASVVMMMHIKLNAMHLIYKGTEATLPLNCFYHLYRLLQ